MGSSTCLFSIEMNVKVSTSVMRWFVGGFLPWVHCYFASSDEADARNLVALTRSKGLSVILLPPATQFVASPLHSLLTQCAFRHGIFNIGAEDLDIEALADFISQPDTTQAGEPAVYTSASWLHTHQISTFGTWDPLPLCLALTYNSQISYFYLSLNQHLPPSNTHTVTAGYFEWSGKLFGSPPTPATISFGRNCLLLNGTFTDC